MKRISYSVIGSNFGDEGKGVAVNWLCKTTKPDYVVKVNGGCQAGHTVEHDNVRHVFRQFSSGTLQGVPTILSQFCLINPFMLLDEEKAILYQRPDLEPVIQKCIIDASATITVPYDEMINIAVERCRRQHKHGSCGFGINETVERSIYHNGHYNINAKDVVNLPVERLMDVLDEIREQYVPARVRYLTDHQSLLDYDEIMFYLEEDGIKDDSIITEYAKCLKQFSNRYQILSTRQISKLGKWKFIFEHSQGLLLDQNNLDFFPHLTRSNTGITNACVLAKQYGIDHINILYVTRAYTTRHGAGALPFEIKEGKLYDNIQDATNIPNEFQDTLRFAPLNLDLMSTYINADVYSAYVNTVSINLMVTCMDHLPPEPKQRFFVEGGKLLSVSTNKEFLQEIYNSIIPDEIYYCSDPAGLTITKGLCDQ